MITKQLKRGVAVMTNVLHNQRKIISIGLAFFCICACSIKTNADTVQSWSLQPIIGNNPSYWAAEPNWTWDDGNPMTTDDSAKWQLTAQLEIGPSLTSTYTNLVKGYYVNYYRVWRGPKQSDNDAENKYRNYTLYSRGFSNNIGAGYATAIFFTPPEEGTYNFDLAGTIDMQSPTAGWGRVTLYILSADGTSATELAIFDLNEEGGYRSNIYPTSFSYNKNVELVEGERFALRLQSVNPSTASSGTSALNFSSTVDGKFTVSVVPAGTVLVIR